MRWFGPKAWNDVLALILIISILGYSAWLLCQVNIEKEIMMFILGVLFAKFGDIVQYYFRKKEGEPGASA